MRESKKEKEAIMNKERSKKTNEGEKSGHEFEKNDK